MEEETGTAEETPGLSFEMADDEPADEPTEEVAEESEETPEPAEEAETEEQTPDELAALKAELDKVRRDRDKAFYELRKTKDKPKEDEKPAFTKAQLIQLYEEHKDDPAVAIQIMEEIANQSGKAKAESEYETREVQNVKQQADAWMLNNFPDFLREDTEASRQLKEAKRIGRLNNHPMGDFLGAASIMFMRLPQIIEQAKKDGANQALKGKMEETRKKSIKEQGPGEGKPRIKSQSNKDSDIGAEVIAKLGLKGASAENYRKMLKNAKQTTIAVD